MFNFGKYKGHTIKDVLKNDRQYVRWLIKNELTHRLDEEDKETISFFINPLKDIDVENITEQDLINILKQRGLLFCAYDYCDEYGTIHYTIDSVYGYHCGSISSMCNIAATNDLKQLIVENFSR